jgi:ribonuclease HI
MCNIDRRAETQLLAMGLNLITKAIEAPSQSTDVLASATTAYQQGKITKNQYMAVINALDETKSTHPYRVWLDSVAIVQQ